MEYHSEDGIEVKFVESNDAGFADVVIIISNNSGGDFVENKIKELSGEILDGLLDKINNLNYKQTSSFDLPVSGKLVRFLIVGAGKKEEITKACLKKLGGYVYSALDAQNANVVLLNNLESVFNESAAIIVSGIELKSWKFDKYKTTKKEQKIKAIHCNTSYIEFNQQKYDELGRIRDGIFLARNLIEEPSNVMTPDKMLEEAEELKRFGVKVSSLDKKDLKKLEMNAMLGVCQGSDQQAYLITMEYRTNKNKPTIVLVGKGVTFDSGGLCLKPSKKMDEMKGDMAGAAVVIGAMKSIALRGINANVVGVIGVVENSISGSAQHPGDIIVSMSGKTIEVINTDAEGRLVLADALWYAQEKFNPDVMIDFATLTGAMEVALGHEFAGLFSNSQSLSDKILQSSRETGEKLWEFPMHSSYEEDIKSNIADIKNVGSGRGAGSITASLFLKQFVKEHVKWAHIDIAGTEWDSKDRALSQKGATGFGVAFVNNFIDKYYEE